jgi:hypothetical protein
MSCTTPTSDCGNLSDDKFLVFNNSAISLVQNSKTIWEQCLKSYALLSNEYITGMIKINTGSTLTLFSGSSVKAVMVYVEYADDDAVNNFLSYRTNSWSYIDPDYTNEGLSSNYKGMSNLLYTDAHSNLPFTDMELFNTTGAVVTINYLYVLN